MKTVDLRRDGALSLVRLWSRVLLTIFLLAPSGAATAAEVEFTQAVATAAGVELAWSIAPSVTVTSLALEKEGGAVSVPLGFGAAMLLLAGASMPFMRRGRRRLAAASLLALAALSLARAAQVIELQPTARSYVDPEVQGGQEYSYRLSVNNGQILSAAVAVTPVSAPDMVLVPSGEFQMGCDGAQGSYTCRSDEDPEHAVLLDAFYIDTYEVTAASYQSCVDAGSCTAAWTTTNCTYGVSGKENHPINCVLWTQAVEYCQWRGRRLPTEAEWEKAARGTDERIFPWGNDAPDCTRANFGNNACVFGTAPVGSFAAGKSPYGADDMAGNVWEWVSDWYDEGYYAVSPYQNPAGPTSGSYRSLRGGAWANSDSLLRGAYRNRYLPTYAGSSYGFRCAKSRG